MLFAPFEIVNGTGAVEENECLQILNSSQFIDRKIGHQKTHEEGDILKIPDIKFLKK